MALVCCSMNISKLVKKIFSPFPLYQGFPNGVNFNKFKYCNVAFIVITRAFRFLIHGNMYASWIDLFNGKFHFDSDTQGLV